MGTVWQGKHPHLGKGKVDPKTDHEDPEGE